MQLIIVCDWSSRATYLTLLLLLGYLAAIQTKGQVAEVKPQDQRGDRPIQDSSFLLEQAHNREDGAIQHIAHFRIQPQTGDWVCAQTEEWPLRSLKHLFTVTLSAAYDGTLPGSTLKLTFANPELTFRNDTGGTLAARSTWLCRLALTWR